MLTVRGLFVLFAALVGGYAFAPPPSATAGAICANQPSIQDGFYGNGPGNYVEGSLAYVITRLGNVCIGGGYAPPGTLNAMGENVVAGWALIASGGPDNNGPGGYIQSGYLREANQSPLYFAEDNRYGGPNYRRHIRLDLTPPTLGSTQRYWEQFTTDVGGTCAGGQYREKANLRVIQVAKFCPFQDWSYPFSPQYAGEGIDRLDDIPGTPQAGMLFSAMQTQDFASNVFSSYLPAMAPANTDPAHSYNPGVIGNDSRGLIFTIYTAHPH